MRGFAVVALNDCKNGQNFGGAIRASRCYAASFVVASGRIARVDHPAAMKGHKHLPVLRVADIFDALPAGCETVAVEYLETSKPLPAFTHPERAFYVFGGEDQTLSPEMVAGCDHRVFVPTVFCMNLAATVNVVLYDRLSKEQAT